VELVPFTCLHFTEALRVCPPLPWFPLCLLLFSHSPPVSSASSTDLSAVRPASASPALTATSRSSTSGATTCGTLSSCGCSSAGSRAFAPFCFQMVCSLCPLMSLFLT
jgi:hypothetical protein